MVVLVDHPWYSRMRYFAAGVTLDYAHNPLIAGLVRPDGTLTQTQSVIEHGVTGHIDIAGSFLEPRAGHRQPADHVL